MNLSFSTVINEKPTYFVEKIYNSLSLIPEAALEIEAVRDYGHYLSSLNKELIKEMKEVFNYNVEGVKIHTIRRDEANRWAVGNKIHFIVHPYGSNRFQFAPVFKVVAIQFIKIKNLFGDRRSVMVDGVYLSKEEIEALALNDGFDCVADFWDYFKNQDFTGKIIHWTNYEYAALAKIA